jgi:hypothetical protein
MRVRLTRKLSDRIDGVRRVGQVLDLPLAQAHLLLAEQWAVPAAVDDPPRRLRDPVDEPASKIERTKPLDPQRRPA